MREHTLLNSLGWCSCGRCSRATYSPLRWLAIYLFSSLTISAGLWMLNPEVPWYVGASGACMA
jgi:membrane associated rhomboid family serine protease